MSTHTPAPTGTKFWTTGVRFMVVMMAIGAAFAIARLTVGLGYVTNLDNQHPWGIWIAIDVATGVVLAAGGFTTAALVYIFGQKFYKPLVRPALLTAVLGYTFVVIGLVLDLGRYYSVWHPLIYPQPNSVLFEVGMCVMFYLTVLYIEFIPIVAEKYRGRVNLPGILAKLNRPVDMFLGFFEDRVEKVIWIFIILGVVLSHMHQSSLGTLMLIAPTKVHPLWYTPVMPLMFLLSAFAVAFPMVIFETNVITRSLHFEDEMKLLTPLSRFTIFLLGAYMLLKLGDILVRGTYTYLLDGTVESNSFIVEVLFGVIIPFTLLLFKKVRENRSFLVWTALLIVTGVVLNRINVFLVSYNPPYAEKSYFPAIGEIAITMSLIAAIMFIYRFVVTYLPVLSSRPKEVE